MNRKSVRRVPVTGLVASIFALIVAVLSGCVSDRMRSLYTTMEGTVKDSSGSPIENAIVYVYGVEPKRTTNSDGKYQIAWVSLGVVEVIAEKDGYKSVIKNTNVELHSNTNGVDFTLISVELNDPEIINGRGIRLQWEKTTDIKFAAYELYRSSSSGASKKDVLVASITNSNKPWAFDSIILDDGTYYYKVFVINKKGEYFASNEVFIQATNVLAGELLRDTTFTAAGSPYLITGDLTIAEDVVLTIEPGATIQFAATDSLSSGEDPYLCELLVEGVLNASGKSDSPITFTSSSANPVYGDWYGIVFRDKSDDARCLIDEAIIKYARIGVKSVLSSPRVRDSSFSECFDGVQSQSSSTIEVTGCSFENIISWAFIATGSSPLFKNNKVSGCRNGVRILDAAEAKIENCIIENSLTGIGVYLQNCSPQVLDNQIAGNDFGILCRDVTSGRINNNQIKDSVTENVRLESSTIEVSSNQIKGSQVGIRISGGAATVEKNFIEENDSGLVLEKECLATVKNNWIRQNKTFGVEIDESAPVITYNEINSTSDGDALGDGIRCRNDSAPLINWNVISSNNRNGIMSFDSDPAITYCNIQNNGLYAVEGGGVLGSGANQGRNYLAGNNGADEEVVDSTIGGIADGTNDWNSTAPIPQYLQVDAVLSAATSAVSGTGPQN